MENSTKAVYVAGTKRMKPRFDFEKGCVVWRTMNRGNALH